MTKKERRTFTQEFKQQIVQLHESGKPRKEIIQEYDLTPSSLDRWINMNSRSEVKSFQDDVSGGS